jgi:hypothetical protein
LSSVTVSISVYTKGYSESVYVNVNKNKQRAVNLGSIFVAVFKLNIPKKEGKKKFEITVQITDFSGDKSVDAKTMTATIDSDGKILKKSSVSDKVDLNEITYKIYWNSQNKGRIEKYLPNSISNYEEGMATFEYYDKNKTKFYICSAKWHKTTKKNIGVKYYGSMPSHQKIIIDEEVSEGQTERRVKYENGDIAEYGSNNGKTFWVLYKAMDSKIELLRMPNELNLEKVHVKYDFSKTHRRFTNPDAFAGFIGALAENNLKLTTTGSCFVEGSCFPSVEHVNGGSIDTLYLDDSNEQKFINAMNKFGFNKQITGKNKKIFENAIKEKSGTLHDSHLHSGFNENFVEIIEI